MTIATGDLADFKENRNDLSLRDKTTWKKLASAANSSGVGGMALAAVTQNNSNSKRPKSVTG